MTTLLSVYIDSSRTGIPDRDNTEMNHCKGSKQLKQSNARCNAVQNTHHVLKSKLETGEAGGVDLLLNTLLFHR